MEQEAVTNDGNDKGSVGLLRFMPRDDFVDRGPLHGSTHENECDAYLVFPR